MKYSELVLILYTVLAAVVTLATAWKEPGYTDDAGGWSIIIFIVLALLMPFIEKRVSH
ncbi:hypothetical protein X802_06910 [Thermococcus guaymasensis DSM 11113]|uniref:Uncharacterized protein n=1 Tax=Thermococcus guaymasensis DSM 11113 TaxID=1432656 RepID=A0A0X1KNF1_9EURY|nr:hypothetical protein X802_06910 [Thermococcus guaymasensis DSM 11113]